MKLYRKICNSPTNISISQWISQPVPRVTSTRTSLDTIIVHGLMKLPCYLSVFLFSNPPSLYSRLLGEGSSIEWRGHLWWSVKRDEERTKDGIPLVTKTKETDTRPERSPRSSPVDNDKFLRTSENKGGSVGDKLRSWSEIWARATNSTLLSTQLISLSANVALVQMSPETFNSILSDQTVEISVEQMSEDQKNYIIISL